MKVVILESAEHDLKELRTYIIRNFSVETWQNSYDKIKAAIRNLKTFPHAGPIPEELEKLSLSQYRQVISGMIASSMKCGRILSTFISSPIAGGN